MLILKSARFVVINLLLIRVVWYWNGCCFFVL